MFKARGTRQIDIEPAPAPSHTAGRAAASSGHLTTRQTATTELVVTDAATTDHGSATALPELCLAPVEIARETATSLVITPDVTPDVTPPGNDSRLTSPDEVTTDPLGETFGLPAMPVDFLDQVRAAQAGDLEAIALVQEIGAMVPEDRRIQFMMTVQEMLDEADSTV